MPKPVDVPDETEELAEGVEQVAVTKAKKPKKLSKKAQKLAAAKASKAGVTAGAGADHKQSEDDRTATGILASKPNCPDIKIISFSLSVHGRLLAEDTTIELNMGQRYGLIGRNGCGKSTFLQCLANREVPLPEHLSRHVLSEEAQPSERSALEYVVESAKEEVAKLDAMIEKIIVEEGPDSDTLYSLYDRQEALDESTFESRASLILVGLGFNKTTIHKKTCDMSGGWRMRVALAHALFIAPDILLLDEPTNHLDLEACVWLENYLSTYSKILVVVSHSQDFLNGVCTNMIVMQQKRIRYWGGNYDVYMQTKAEQDKNQWTQYKKQQAEIAHAKEFIASCGTFSNLVKQAKSRQKQLDKMVEDGLIEQPFSDPVFRFKFPESGKLTPPLISFSGEVAFSYSGKPEDYLFKDLNFGVDSDSRISLVGPNGAGKSTLLKLMIGEIHPCCGNISIRGGMSIGRYHQHSAEVLDNNATPVEYIQSKFKDRYPAKKLEDWRAVVGTYGVPSEYHLNPIYQLSEGLKTRLVFCEISLMRPHLLLLDEPTNAADMEMIDSMAEAIQKFEGGVILISHDFRLLSQVADEIWVVDGGVKKWGGDIRSYKAALKKSHGI